MLDKKLQATSNCWKHKMMEWLKRYGPAELGGIIAAYLAFFAVKYFFNYPIVTAYSGAIGETVGFYSIIILRELTQHSEFSAIKKLLNLITEFGPAEALDSLILRPLFMGIGIHYLGALSGILIGKIAADVTFYIPVIISYELRKRFYQRKDK